jgi:ElaB/YqjD/DUF883 family membrane-anchored ribosome-binding protein
MTLGFQYLGDLQEKSLQVQTDIKKLCEELKKVSESILKANEAAQAASAKVANELSEFASKVTSACEDMLTGVRLAREYLEEYKKEHEKETQPPQAPQPKRKGPKPSSLSEVAAQIKAGEKPEEKKKE